MTEPSAGQRTANRRRRSVVAVLTLVASPLVWVALALACTPHASMSLTTANGVIAQPGAAATVTGNAFGAGRVDVRWDSTSGPVLATATGPSFSLAITVPAAAPGFHNVVAIGRDPAGNVVGQAVAVLEIPDAETPPAAADPSASPTSSGAATEAAGAPAHADAASPAAATAAPAASRPTASPPRPAAPARRPAAQVPSRPQARPSAPSRPTTKPAELRPPRDGARPANAPAPARAVAHGVARAEAAPSARRPRRESQGLTTRPSAAPRAPRTEPPPSLVGPADAATAVGADGTRFGIGISLLALGLVLPLAGFVIAEARRRRLPVERRR